MSKHEMAVLMVEQSLEKKPIDKFFREAFEEKREQLRDETGMSDAALKDFVNLFINEAVKHRDEFVDGVATINADVLTREELEALLSKSSSEDLTNENASVLISAISKLPKIKERASQYGEKFSTKIMKKIAPQMIDIIMEDQNKSGA